MTFMAILGYQVKLEKASKQYLNGFWSATEYQQIKDRLWEELAS